MGIWCSTLICMRRRTGSTRRCVCFRASRSASGTGSRCGCTMPRPRSAQGSSSFQTKPGRPGSKADIQLVLDRPIAAAAGDPYVVRDTSAKRTIGGGHFLDLRAPVRKRRTAERAAQLDAYACQAPQQAMTALLDAPPHYLNLSAFARDRALRTAEVERPRRTQWQRPFAAAGSVLAISAANFARFHGDLLSRLVGFHADNPDILGLPSNGFGCNSSPVCPRPHSGACCWASHAPARLGSMVPVFGSLATRQS